ncbi:MAG: saccharopine dehydrogenase NADP-binding domain-containing protein [Chitinophagales bacterium]|nr:saccharopine dehydrogenase NADP-binding domain-containing protein [Chitinophagales bacterium]
MKNILVLGAGRSSTVLITYLLDHSMEWNAKITVGDLSLKLAASKVGNHPNGNAIYFNANDEKGRKDIIQNKDIIVSLLPPALHLAVAKDCIEFKKQMVTASYVTPEMQMLDSAAKENGLLFMCEMGLDPGIDHMSAMKMIHKVKDNEGIISSFKSGTGGLVAPESDNNPWHYKITWNPQNVVMAGKGTAQYLENGKKKLVPYHRLFTETGKFKIKNYGKFESYPNRDSLAYISKYELNGIKTLLRTTLRKQGYSAAWNAVVQLGLTDDSYSLHDLNTISYGEWLSGYLPENTKWKDAPLQERTAKFLGVKQEGRIIKRLKWLGLFSREKIPLSEATPAKVMEDLIIKKWAMLDDENDMIVMRHELKYYLQKKEHELVSTMILPGENSHRTAMAKTVGLPLGIMVKLLIQQKIVLTGVHIPVMAEIYEPVLQELQEYGIEFTEKETY